MEIRDRIRRRREELGLLACAAGIALIWICARDMSTFIVVLLIIGAIVTGVIAHALADKAL